MTTVMSTPPTRTMNKEKPLKDDSTNAADTSLKALVLAGTSDARELCKRALTVGVKPTAGVVTREAAAAYRELDIPVHTGKMRAIEMTDLAMRQELQVIIDASHPYANLASEEAIKASKILSIPYIRYERPAANLDFENAPATLSKEMLLFAEDDKNAAKLIQSHIQTLRESTTLAFPGKPLLTIFLATGSKTLETFSSALLPQKDIRMVVRFLPRKENLELCEKLGIEPKNIVAMQGPYSEELNKTMLRNYQAGLLVTKESGSEGSTIEKLAAAASLGIPVIMIRRPIIDYPNLCHTMDDALALAKKLVLQKSSPETAQSPQDHTQETP